MPPTSVTDAALNAAQGSHTFFGSLFGVFGFVTNNQNSVSEQFFQAFRDFSEPFPCSSTFLFLSWGDYKKELVNIFSVYSKYSKKKRRGKSETDTACLEERGVFLSHRSIIRRTPPNTPHPVSIFFGAFSLYLSSNWIFSLALFCILLVRAKET